MSYSQAMTTPLDGHRILPAMEDPGLDLNSMTVTGSDEIHTVISDRLGDAMTKLTDSYQELVSVRAAQESHSFRPFVGVADHVCAMSEILAKLMADLTSVSFSRQAMNYATTQAIYDDGGLPDPEVITDLDQDIKELRRIQEHTQVYHLRVSGDHNELQQRSHSEFDGSSDSLSPVYNLLQGHVSPGSIRSPGSATSANGKGASPDRRSKLPSRVQAQASREKSPPALSDKDHFANFNLDQWKRRGKGDYYCPRKYECTKGGVNSDGELVKFERNSAYVQHCNKHKRPFVCERPGCPNPVSRRSFARADGLRRHQTTVPHGDPCNTEPDSSQLPGRNSSASQDTVRTPGSRSYLKPENNFSEDSEMGTAPKWPFPG